MKDFEELTEDKQNEVIMNIGTKLTGQEIWYWEGLVHKLREYDKYFDSDEEIRKKLIDRIKRQEKEIEELKNVLKNGINEELRKELDEILKCNQRQASRIDRAIEYIQDRYDGEALTHTFDKCNVKELLKILQGSDKE